MGIGLSLLTLCEVARITAPTFADAITGKLTRDSCDRRLEEFGNRVIERARIQIEIVGRELVPAERSFVYMSNHQSHLDIPILFATVPARTLRMVAKKELFKVPFWGSSMRAAGFIEVDRSNREQSIASLERAATALADGISIWIAPEGTRSSNGELGELKKGGFHLACDTGTPIVPVAIDGTNAILPPHSSKMAYDMPVRVVFGAPIPTQGKPPQELRAEVERFLRRHVGPALRAV